MDENTGIRIGQIGDVEITEQTLVEPGPEMEEFVQDINTLNKEPHRSPYSWQQKEALRIKRKRLADEEIRREIAALNGGSF